MRYIRYREKYPEWIEYTKEINRHVKFKYDHEEIRDEYLEHMEDMHEFYVGSGVDESLAKYQVLADMGDPEDLGRVLNEIHNPLLGWVWRMSRWLLILLIVLAIYPAIVMFGSSAICLVQPYEEISVSAPLVNEIDIREFRSLDNEVYYFDKLERYEDGTVIIYWIAVANPFDRATIWHAYLPGGGFFDEKGNQYDASGQGSGNAGYAKKGVHTIKEFPKSAETLIYDFHNGSRRVYVEVPLGGGKVVES